MGERLHEYKVLSSISTYALQGELNRLAAEGWNLYELYKEDPVPYGRDVTAFTVVMSRYSEELSR